MKETAIAGASGFIGRHLIEALGRKNEHSLRLLGRDTDRLTRPHSSNTSQHQCDLLDYDSLVASIDGATNVVNLAFLGNRPETEHMLAVENLVKACAEAGVKRIVHCSTAVVVGKSSDNIINETTQCLPITQYEKIKYQTEKKLLKTAPDSIEIAIIRPTAVFGPDGANLIKLASDLIRGRGLINYCRSSLFGHRRMNLVAISNVVSAITFLLEIDRTINRDIFIISDDEYHANNYSDVEEILIRNLDLLRYPIKPVSVPPFLLSMLLAVVGRSNANPRRIYDCSKLMRFGFVKPDSFDKNLSIFCNWFRTTYPSKK